MKGIDLPAGQFHWIELRLLPLSKTTCDLVRSMAFHARLTLLDQHPMALPRLSNRGRHNAMLLRGCRFGQVGLSTGAKEGPPQSVAPTKSSASRERMPL